MTKKTKRTKIIDEMIKGSLLNHKAISYLKSLNKKDLHNPFFLIHDAIKSGNKTHMTYCLSLVSQFLYWEDMIKIYLLTMEEMRYVFIDNANDSKSLLLSKEDLALYDEYINALKYSIKHDDPIFQQVGNKNFKHIGEYFSIHSIIIAYFTNSPIMPNLLFQIGLSTMCDIYSQYYNGSNLLLIKTLERISSELMEEELRDN